MFTRFVDERSMFLTHAGTPAAFTASGLRTHEGKELQADLVIYATGFVRQYDFLPFADLKALGQTCEGIPLYRDVLPLSVPVRVPVIYRLSPSLVPSCTCCKENEKAHISLTTLPIESILRVSLRLTVCGSFKTTSYRKA